jgi:hypothetical protein
MWRFGHDAWSGDSAGGWAQGEGFVELLPVAVTGKGGLWDYFFAWVRGGVCGQRTWSRDQYLKPVVRSYCISLPERQRTNLGTPSLPTHTTLLFTVACVSSTPLSRPRGALRPAYPAMDVCFFGIGLQRTPSAVRAQSTLRFACVSADHHRDLLAHQRLLEHDPMLGNQLRVIAPARRSWMRVGVACIVRNGACLAFLWLVLQGKTRVAWLLHSHTGCACPEIESHVNTPGGQLSSLPVRAAMSTRPTSPMPTLHTLSSKVQDGQVL